jgi:flagellar basal-body rod protein FlgB
MISKLDDAIRFQQTALRIRGQRQEIIAANIANADTPNYKARDIDFGAALNNALSGIATQAIEPTKTSPQHLSTDGTGSTVGAGSSGPQYRKVLQNSVNGNTVDMDVERNQFMENAIRYEASLTAVNDQLKRIIAALQG